MRTQVELDAERPQELKKILEPSLSSDQNVNYNLRAEQNTLKIEVETDGIGPLRGCTDTIFRLSTLATKLY